MKPRCFKRMNVQKLPVEWTPNKTAWMDAKVFEKWLKDLNMNMKRQCRNILLFLDNAPCHPQDLQLSNIKLQFFPANTTSVVQPLDQGVIRSFKAHYRKSLVKHVIARSTTAQTANDINITALDAVFWIDSAWQSVTNNTIRNTFLAAGFKEKQAENLTDGINLMISDSSSRLDDLSVIDVGINEEMQVLDGLLKHVIISGETMVASEFVNLDLNVPPFNVWNDDSEKIINVSIDSGINESDEDEEKDNEETPPKLSEALQIVQRLRFYSVTQCPQLHQAISDIESKLTDIYLDSKVSFQSTIDSYFTKG